ncbi:hypothetical protein DFQ28_009410 [Apophysomyces sp. BC1034]|nr:hypothetical protein DFQ30_008573 [Apophysomyces sp. BC1015]KAG0173791.1 hypothetical protein DFQ29_007753 [Apophysomyces sp. BC1021]KAG0185393.1 hypothetical protein DFQ28_009410 [Apophysomyces sp. BC1034]
MVQFSQSMEDTARRLRYKKPSPSPSSSTSSYVISPRWIPKQDITDNSIQMAQDQKKRSVWNDTLTVKKKVFSPLDGEDPFAGMNSCIDYEAEIERLKALVPKVEAKKRPSPRPRSTGDATIKPPRSNMEIPTRTSLPPSKSTTPPKPVPVQRLPTSPPRSRPTSALDMADKPSRTDNIQTSPPTTRPTSPVESNTDVVSDEDKIRFLEFVRSWTGGWRGWETNRDSVESIKEAGSLWAEQTPWDSTVDRQRRSLQESTTPLTMREQNTGEFFEPVGFPRYPL